MAYIEFWKIRKSGTVISVLVAFIVFNLVRYLQTKISPDFAFIALMALGIVSVGFWLEQKLRAENFFGMFFLGVLSYATTFALLTFFKINQATPDLSVEFTNVLIFGGLVALTYYVFGKKY